MDATSQAGPGNDADIAAVLRASLEELPVGFVIYDPDDRLIFCNPVHKRSYALSADAMVPGARFEDILRYGLQRNQYPEAGRSSETRARWLADRLAHYRAADRPLIQQVGPSQWLRIHERRLAAGHTVSIWSDISALHHLETDLIKANDALAAANEELQGFAYAASHDLRSPIQTMRSLLDILEEDYFDTMPEDARAIVGRLTGVAERMIRLSNGVLDYARVSGSSTASAPFDCGKLLAGVIADLEAEIAAEDARIAIGPMPRIVAIREQIGQVFQNLIGNSLKFHSPDRPSEITVTARLAHRFHEFTITDNGIGLSQDDSEAIFAPFRRLHGRHRFAGSGLGLTICRRIVLAHGGRIRAENRDTAGARFIFTLPETPHV